MLKNDYYVVKNVRPALIWATGLHLERLSKFLRSVSGGGHA